MGRGWAGIQTQGPLLCWIHPRSLTHLLKYFSLLFPQGGVTFQKDQVQIQNIWLWIMCLCAAMLLLRTLISCNLASKSLTLDQFNGLLLASLRVRVLNARLFCPVSLTEQAHWRQWISASTPYVAEGRGEHVRHSLRQSWLVGGRHLGRASWEPSVGSRSFLPSVSLWTALIQESTGDPRKN